MILEFNNKHRYIVNWLPRELKNAGILKSTSEAIKLIKQGGITVNGENINTNYSMDKEGMYTVKIGKRRFIRFNVVGNLESKIISELQELGYEEIL